MTLEAGKKEELDMSVTTEPLPDRRTLPGLSDWAEAGFPLLDEIPATHGVHVEERLADRGGTCRRPSLRGSTPRILRSPSRKGA
ncbi:hypothetical protein GCM10017771_70590 [Streptomyces capitiformicae]|uniref:Uncharacterized protein n=1 Tax=Streptomyces capitiformicae TaxID=2014920 RepID=A0A919DHY8_9ACTN|nr:hypothetical protein GCM10017771_70590 [Streptomyces capitiformicae]